MNFAEYRVYVRSQNSGLLVLE